MAPRARAAAAPRSLMVKRVPTGSWRAETLPGATGELAAVWGSSGSDVWAVGAGFGIVHFDGNAWRTGPAAPDGATADLLAVGGSGRGDVYFVGRGGLVAHLGADGTLATQPSPKPFDLYAVWASGPEDIYAVGDYGLILHSTGDGTWSVQESGTRDSLSPACMRRTLRAWWASEPRNARPRGSQFSGAT